MTIGVKLLIGLYGLLATFDQTKEAATTNECTSFAGHFNSHGGAMVQYRAHRPIEEVQVFHKSH